MTAYRPAGPLKGDGNCFCGDPARLTDMAYNDSRMRCVEDAPYVPKMITVTVRPGHRTLTGLR